MPTESPLRSRKRVLLLLAGASGVGSLVALACGPRSVTLSLDVPGAVDDATRWYEVGAIEGSKCPSAEQLAGGVPSGYRVRKVFSKGNAPNFGNLVAGEYAFIAVAKGEDCKVLAAGCSIANVTSDDEVSVKLSNVDNGALCSTGTVCQAGQCVPPNDNNHPSLGVGCTLDLVGSGPLADPLGAPTATDQVTSQPSIAATPKGFMIAYRETQGPINTMLTLVPIDNGGGALAPQQTVLEGCGALRDGVGMAFHGEEGLVAAAKPCKPTGGTSPGILVFSIDADGKTRQGGFSLLPCADCAAETKLFLGVNHSVAWSDPLNAFLIAFNQAGQSQVLTRTAPPKVTKFGSAGDLDAQILAQGAFLGLLSLAPNGGTPVDGGTTKVEDAGAPNKISANLVAADKLASVAAPTTTPGTWATATVLGKRIFVVTDGTNKRLTLLGYEPKASTPDQLARPVNDPDISESTVGDPAFADITGQGDRLFIVTQRANGTTLLAIDHAATTPVRIREVLVPGTGAATGGRIAVAASDSRVAVVWLSRPDLTANDRVGGYSVFACR